jgi:hypothetical protein
MATTSGRGEPEIWIKDPKNALQADRLSDRHFWPNVFRLLLRAAAYWLLDTLPQHALRLDPMNKRRAGDPPPWEPLTRIRSLTDTIAPRIRP